MKQDRSLPWTLSFKASGRYPMIANRIYSTLAEAQAYIDAMDDKASAIPGLILSVTSDTLIINNGIYFVKSLAKIDETTGEKIPGELIKVGSIETPDITNHTEALKQSENFPVGQIIRVLQDTTVNGEYYPSGLYIVQTPGSLIIPITAGTVTDKIESNVPIRVDLSVFDDKSTGTLSEIIDNLDDFSYQTTDICIGGYYPTQKEILSNSTEFYYYIPFKDNSEKEELYIVCLAIFPETNSWAFSKTSVSLKGNELDSLFQDEQ